MCVCNYYMNRSKKSDQNLWSFPGPSDGCCHRDPINVALVAGQLPSTTATVEESLEKKMTSRTRTRTTSMGIVYCNYIIYISVNNIINGNKNGS